MVPVREGISTRETWPFECLHCARVWEEEYVVHRGRHEDGDDVVVWTRDGAAVQPPWSGMTCPGCGCGTVTTFSTGCLANRREITPGLPALRHPAGEETARGGWWFASHGLLGIVFLLPSGFGM